MLVRQSLIYPIAFLVAMLGFQAQAQPKVTEGVPLIAAPTDTLQLTLTQAEEQFTRQNLNLMIAQLGISESQKQEIQSKLRPNPTIYAEIMPYNNGTATAGKERAILPFRQSNSEQIIQLQQLLLLAGKRNKQLAIAQTSTEIARDRFQDVIRTLRYDLRSTFYSLYFNQQSISIYDEEIQTLQQTVTLYQQQYEKGNVPLKDLTRLKAYLFNLTTEKQSLILQLANDQAELAVLLNMNPATVVRPEVTTQELEAYNPTSLTLNDLYNRAEENRYDLKAYTDQSKLEQQNLILQKALAKPDLTVQATFDRNGAFGSNYIGVGVGLPVPIFNKNQGNIEAAKIRTQASQQGIAAYRLQVQSEVQKAYVKVLQTNQLYQQFDTRFNEDFSRLIDGVTTNYRKQNIDVVEFLDFFDSYKNSQIQYRQLQNNRMQSLEELGYAVGTNVFSR